MRFTTQLAIGKALFGIGVLVIAPTMASAAAKASGAGPSGVGTTQSPAASPAQPGINGGPNATVGQSGSRPDNGNAGQDGMVYPWPGSYGNFGPNANNPGYANQRNSQYKNGNVNGQRNGANRPGTSANRNLQRGGSTTRNADANPLLPQNNRPGSVGDRILKARQNMVTNSNIESNRQNNLSNSPAGQSAAPSPTQSGRGANASRQAVSSHTDRSSAVPYEDRVSRRRDFQRSDTLRESGRRWNSGSNAGTSLGGFAAGDSAAEAYESEQSANEAYRHSGVDPHNMVNQSGFDINSPSSAARPGGVPGGGVGSGEWVPTGPISRRQRATTNSAVSRDNSADSSYRRSTGYRGLNSAEDNRRSALDERSGATGRRTTWRNTGGERDQGLPRKPGMLDRTLYSNLSDVQTQIGLAFNGGNTLVVGNVAVGGIGARAGLRAGDRILSVDGQDVTTASDLSRIIASFAPGTSARVVVDRDGRDFGVTLPLGGPRANPARSR